MHRRRTAGSQAPGDDGFTISEFILVVIVFTTLIAIVVWSLRGIDDESAARDCRSELRAIKAASERFNAELGVYPKSDKLLQDAGYLQLSDTPNYRVYTRTEGGGPVYEAVGSRCR